MGMAASQARFLGLTARKTNVEFEGQQINQQRTTLSNESSGYYSQLCNMSVPTPPSSDDYTKTIYTFSDGSEDNTINSLIAKENGWYILNYTQSYETESVVSNGNVIVTRQSDSDNDDNNYNYYIGATKLYKLGDEDDTRIKNDSYLKTLDSTQLEQTLALESQYATMLTEKYGDENWFVRYQKNSSTGTYEPVFYSQNQIENADFSDKTGASLSTIKSYTYGMTTETQEIKNAAARVEQDTNGRYISVIIYDKDSDGNPTGGGTEYSLTATTQTDDAAYNDAMNQYNYEKAVYNQELNNVNSKIEIIQSQDKDLELRLKQLDTEQNAINTEMESVKKVISKNVENTFKTFQA
jgi:hypothetical protein